jgi:hypothetical protein
MEDTMKQILSLLLTLVITANSTTVTVSTATVAELSKSASANVVPTSPRLSISPQFVDLQAGGQQQFAATVSSNSSAAVTWAVNGIPGGNPSIGTISSLGIYTAPASSTNGELFTIAATLADDTTRSAIATVAVGPVRLPASVVAGALLAAVTSFNISQNHQWKDYESLMAIVVLNQVVKGAVSSGQHLMATDYGTIATQVENWLDARTPPNPVFLASDETVRLRRAIDTISLMAGSVPAGSPVLGALATVENVKFTELESPLDPVRLRPNDLDLSSVAMKASSFVADQIQEAVDLAQNDSQYAAAVNPLIKNLTGLDTQSSFADIKNQYPNIVPNLPGPNGDGSFTVDAQDLMNQYQTLINRAQTALNDAFTSFETTNSTTGSTNSHAISTTSLSVALDDSLTNCKKDKPQESPICWNVVQSTINGLSKLIGFISPPVGAKVGVIGSAIVQAGRAIDQLLTGKLTLQGVLDDAQSIGGAVAQVFSFFGHHKGSDPNAAILQQLQKLSDQINRLQQDMDSRFDQVDTSLRTIIASLAQIDFKQTLLSGDVHAIQAAILDIQTQLNQIETLTATLFRDGELDLLEQEMNGCLNFRATHNGAAISSDKYNECENFFFTWAVNTAKNEIWAGLQQQAFDDASVFKAVGDFLSSVNVNLLAQYPQQNLQLQSLSVDRLPNPNAWILGVRAYLELAHEWPQYAKGFSSSRLDDQAAVGLVYVRAVRNGNSLSNGGTIAANRPLFTALVNKYLAAEIQLKNALMAEVTSFTGDPSNPDNAKLQGLNVFGGAFQPTTFPPAVFNLASRVPVCGNSNKTVEFPPLLMGLVTFVRAQSQSGGQFGLASPGPLAEKLGLGSMDLCLSYSTVPAGTGVSTGGQLASGVPLLGSYQIEGRTNGQLVFARRFYTVGDSNCGPDQLWNPVTPCGPLAGFSQFGAISSLVVTRSDQLISSTPGLQNGPTFTTPCWPLNTAPPPQSPNFTTAVGLPNFGTVVSPSPEFQALIDQGYKECWQLGNPFHAFPLRDIFLGDPVDTTDGINAVAKIVNDFFRKYQQGLYKQMADSFTQSTPVQRASAQLTGAKLLLQDYINFVLPNSSQTNDVLHADLAGRQAILDGTALQTDFASFASSITDVTDNKISDEITAMNSRLADLGKVLDDALNQIEQTQLPESPTQIDLVLEELRAFEALKDAGAITPCHFELSNNITVLNAAGGTATVELQTADGCAWTANTGASWLSISGATGSGTGSFGLSVQPNTTGTTREGLVVIGDQTYKVFQNPGQLEGLSIIKQGPGNGALTSNDGFISCGLICSAEFDVGTMVTLTPIPASGSTFAGWGGACSGTQACILTMNSSQTVFATFTQQTQTLGLRLVPVTPCRIADTRNANGPFGGPFLTGGVSRGFTVPNSACGIPLTAGAYSINATVVPKRSLGFLTMFPCGQALPLASTLNSIDGRVKAGAAIVPAGTGGAVCGFASDDTDLILDINGYFVSATNTSALAFYPLTPCRLVDTREATAPLGGPSLVGNTARTFPILSSSCNVPSAAQVYSLNYTSVPKDKLGFLTTWPTGQAQPLVSTLNAPTGAVTANAAIVPAGTDGAVSVFVTNDSDLVIDINGYFAPPGPGGLSLFPLAPCRVLDTRNPMGSQAFAGDLAVNVAASGCGALGSAESYVLNATAVPQGPLGFLTIWPQGTTQPLVSTLNAVDGSVTSNMAIVPTTNGSVSVFAPNPTHLVLDISAYFAP